MLKLKLLFILLLLISGFGGVSAQENSEPQEQQFTDEPRRPQLLRELELSQPQIRGIRQINVENREKLRDANLRLREARLKLDAAIYADNLDETVYANALQNLYKAQAEVARIRAATELRIRKLLTPEQLIRFRELRAKFSQFKEDRQDRLRELKDKSRRQPPDNRRQPSRRN